MVDRPAQHQREITQESDTDPDAHPAARQRPSPGSEHHHPGLTGRATGAAAPRVADPLNGGATLKYHRTIIITALITLDAALTTQLPRDNLATVAVALVITVITLVACQAALRLG